MSTDDHFPAPTELPPPATARSAAPSSKPVRWAQAARTACTVVALGLGAIFLLAVISLWPSGFDTLDRGSINDPQTSGSVSLSRGALLGATLATIVLVCARLGHLRAAFGVRLPRSQHPWAALVRLAVLFMVADLMIWSARIWVLEHRSQASASVAREFGDFPLSQRLLLAAYAGSWEETLNVAVPVGLACCLWWLARQVRAPSGVLVHAPTRIPAWCLAAGVIGLVTRYTDHLYQGQSAAVGAVLWGVVALVLFAWSQSVLPLILGHFLFDAAIAGRPVTALTITVLAVLLALTFIPTLQSRRRRQARGASRLT